MGSRSVPRIALRAPLPAPLVGATAVSLRELLGDPPNGRTGIPAFSFCHVTLRGQRDRE